MTATRQIYRMVSVHGRKDCAAIYCFLAPLAEDAPV